VPLFKCHKEECESHYEDRVARGWPRLIAGVTACGQSGLIRWLVKISSGVLFQLNATCVRAGQPD
jgi:hypothetical protein